MNYVDLHVHSLVSDGSMRPEEIAVHAAERGLSAFALTDHDNIAGDAAAWQAAADLGLGFLPGMELSVQLRGRKLHIVCLGFAADNPSFQAIYRRVRAGKEAKIPEIIAYIAAKGIPIHKEDVEAYAYGPLDRYAIMRYLVSLHLYDHAQPLWDNYLDPAVKALGLSSAIEAEEALPLIHAAGGVTSLAHFHKRIGLKGLTRAEQERAVCDLQALGLDGMEAWYPNYSEEDRAFAAYLIGKYHLLPTAGTDYHGANRPEIELGSGLAAENAIPYDIFGGVAARVRRVLLPACDV